MILNRIKLGFYFRSSSVAIFDDDDSKTAKLIGYTGLGFVLLTVALIVLARYVV